MICSESEGVDILGMFVLFCRDLLPSGGGVFLLCFCKGRCGMDNRERIDILASNGTLPRDELVSLISGYSESDREYAAKKARSVSVSIFGKRVFFRGLIELTNFCRNDCYYCGIRRSNRNVQRYRLTEDDVLSCCDYGYELGFRTFVLQGGEDEYFTDDRVVRLVSMIKGKYPDCALTLSLGEKSRESYQRFYDAGANRYLLRHETATPSHYSKLHPKELSLANRMRCLDDLRDIGYQAGCGFMVGSPYQTDENIADDLLYMKGFDPQMVGIGPFIPHKDTPFRDYQAGSAEKTLFLLSLVRLMLPYALLPATTALGTVQGDGREQGILAGANVVMPNISPSDVRKFYLLYDNKIGTKDDASESVSRMSENIKKIGYEVVVDRGDYTGRRSAE